MGAYKDMTDEYLRANYVPDVYQPSIYAIDYRRLKAHGIRLLSFDIDDTITGLENRRPPKAAVTLFENLKKMGFVLVLLTNARDSRGKSFGGALQVDYVARARKPLTANFQLILEQYAAQHPEGLEKSQMAHIGNSLLDDVAGGNTFGITTCLVRRVGRVSKLPGLLSKTESQKLRDELKARGIWRKHHKDCKNDQYYQLGETPGYRNEHTAPP